MLYFTDISFRLDNCILFVIFFVCFVWVLLFKKKIGGVGVGSGGGVGGWGWWWSVCVFLFSAFSLLFCVCV